MSYKDLVVDELAFELAFFEAIAGTDKFEIIPINHQFMPTPEEMELLQEQCDKDGLELLYKISHKDVATIYCAKTGKTGIIPESNTYGFDC